MFSACKELNNGFNPVALRVLSALLLELHEKSMDNTLFSPVDYRMRESH